MKYSLLDLLVSQVALAAQKSDHNDHDKIGAHADLASFRLGLVELHL